MSEMMGVEVSRCCKAPIWKDETGYPICDKCRAGCRVEVVASPGQSAPTHDPTMCPDYERMIQSPFVEGRGG